MKNNFLKRIQNKVFNRTKNCELPIDNKRIYLAKKVVENSPYAGYGSPETLAKTLLSLFEHFSIDSTIEDCLDLINAEIEFINLAASNDNSVVYTRQTLQVKLGKFLSKKDIKAHKILSGEQPNPFPIGTKAVYLLYTGTGKFSVAHREKMTNFFKRKRL